MPFDPNAYNKIKESLKPASAGGFDPATYARVRAQVAAPQPTQARPGPVGRAFDFTRRAFMGNSVNPEDRNTIQKALNDAKDIIMGTSQLIGQTAVEGGKLGRDAVVSAVKPLAKLLGPNPIESTKEAYLNSPLAERIKDFPSQVATSASPEGRKIAMDDVIKPAVESFKNSFVHPIKSFSEHPLFTFIDWATAGSLAGSMVKGGLRVAGATARTAKNIEVADNIAKALSGSREALSVAPRGEISRTFSGNPLIKFGIEKPLDKISANPELQEFVSSSPVLKYIAPQEFLTPEIRAGRVAEQVANKSQAEYFRLRNERMQEVQDMFNKLPDWERKDFIPIIQGRAIPRMQSPQFKEVFDWYKNKIATEQDKFHLADETVKRVAYQPLAVAQGILTPEDYAAALKGDTEAMARVTKATNEFADARVRIQEQAIKEWLYKGKSGRPTSELVNAARELAKETAPDPLYFPSVFENKIKLSDFMPSRFLQRFKPGFMKGRTGAFGFIENDPAAAFAIHQSQVERYLQNEHLINSIKDKFAIPLNKASELKPGYKIFTPDGYLGFYRGSMPLQEAFLRGVGMGQGLDDAFTSAVKEVMPSMVKDRAFVGVRKPQIYQIPADVAKNVQEIIMPQAHMPEAVKFLWDKPLQAFKFSVLAMSPRWIVNNTVGNIVTTISGRVSPESYVKASMPLYKELIPSEVAAGGFRRAEFPGLKKLITPETGLSDKITGFFTGKLPTEGALKGVQNVVSAPVKVAGKLANTVFEANAKIEDAFRSATFIDKTVKAATEKISKQVSTGLFDMKSTLDKFLQRGSFADSNVAKTAAEMLKDDTFKSQMVGKVNDILNDYNKLSKFERSIVRRVVPFWSWWKFVNVLFWSMPVKDPQMAQIIKQLGVVGQDIAAGEWKANGLNIKEIPEWMRGNVILGRANEGKLLQMLNTRSMNPLSSASEFPGLGPQFQIFNERRTGRNYLTNAPFTHPNEIENRGSIYRLESGKAERLDHPTPPPLLTHIARQFPQINILEALAFPYKQFTGEGLFSGYPRTSRGKPIEVKPELRIAGILGAPVTEADYRQLRQARIQANQARQLINKQIRRTGRTLERIKLGAE